MSDIDDKTEVKKEEPKYNIAEPHHLSKRAKWLRDYYFKGVEREWNNEYMSFTTGTDWDIVWFESDYYVTPEIYFYIGNKDKGVFEGCLRSVAIPVSLPDGFWDLSLPELRTAGKLWAANAPFAIKNKSQTGSLNCLNLAYQLKINVNHIL